MEEDYTMEEQDWRTRFCIDLIDSRNETKLVQDLDNCPVKENGREIGIMDSTAQNLKG